MSTAGGSGRLRPPLARASRCATELEQRGSKFIELASPIDRFV